MGLEFLKEAVSAETTTVPGWGNIVVLVLIIGMDARLPLYGLVKYLAGLGVYMVLSLCRAYPPDEPMPAPPPDPQGSSTPRTTVLCATLILCLFIVQLGIQDAQAALVSQ